MKVQLQHQELEKQIKDMTAEAWRLEAKAEGLNGGADNLRKQLINSVFEFKGIEMGDDCMVRFDDGPQRVRIVRTDHRIHVRNYNSNGKLLKSELSYGYQFAELFTKATE